MAEIVYYRSIADAEQAITDAGFARNGARAFWLNSAGKAVKVERDDLGRFLVKWA